MTQVKHTPLPWELITLPRDKFLEIQGVDKFVVAAFDPNEHAEESANAAFIVRACNSHYKLLADAEKKKSALNKIHGLLHTHKFSDEEVKNNWLIQEVLQCVELAWDSGDGDVIAEAKGGAS